MYSFPSDAGTDLPGRDPGPCPPFVPSSPPATVLQRSGSGAVSQTPMPSHRCSNGHLYPPLGTMPVSEQECDHSIDVNAVLARAGIFRRVAPDAVDGMIRQLPPVVRFPAAHVVYSEGCVGDSAYIIVSGKVKIGCRAPGGRENLSAVLGQSDMFGELSVFDGGPRSEEATSITPVQLVVLGRDILRAWMADQPEIGDELLRNLSRQLRRSSATLVDRRCVDVAGRVARQLLLQAQRFGVQKGSELHVTHDLTQEELAYLVGATRETVNKALAGFVDRGWIRLEAKKVTITDPARLARRAQCR